jgi:hypothetical protein
MAREHVPAILLFRPVAAGIPSDSGAPIEVKTSKGNQARKEKNIHVNLPKEELQCAGRDAHTPTGEDGNR